MTKIKMLSQGLVANSVFDLERRDLYIEGKVFVQEPSRTCDEVFNASNHIILPGFVDAHFHSNETFFKGMFDMMPLELWALFTYSANTPVRFTPPQAYVRTILSAAELLFSGTTTAVDHVFDPCLSEGNMEAIAKAYEDAGLRVVICPGIADIGPEETFPGVQGIGRPAKSCKKLLQTTEGYLNRYRQNELVSVGLGPSRPQRCTDELLLGIVHLAEKHDAVIHTHFLETRYQAAIAGGNLIPRLRKLNFSSERVSFSHCVWNGPEENDFIRSTGASVVNNPVSNMKLGSGIANMSDFVSQDVNVALGTDGAGSNDSLSMSEVIKTACLLSKLRDGKSLKPLDVLKAATEGGAKSAGLSQNIGRIQPGMLADLILIPMDQISLVPFNNLINQIAYCTPRISHVMVNGEWSLIEGQPSRFRLAEILAEATRMRAQLDRTIEASIKGANRIKKRVEPYLRRVLGRLEK